MVSGKGQYLIAYQSYAISSIDSLFGFEGVNPPSATRAEFFLADKAREMRRSHRVQVVRKASRMSSNTVRQEKDKRAIVVAIAAGLTPVPFSNTVVKPVCAKDTWWATAREIRTLPHPNYKQNNLFTIILL